MRKAHREAARVLYDSRNKHGTDSAEIFVDLHGLHPEEAIDFLEDKLIEQQGSGKIVYAITGTGHHSKSGKDKIGKAIKNWLGEWRYAYREFSAGGADGLGGILGIDPETFDKSMLNEKGGREEKADGKTAIGSTKVKLMKSVEGKAVEESSQP